MCMSSGCTSYHCLQQVILVKFQLVIFSMILHREGRDNNLYQVPCGMGFGSDFSIIISFLPTKNSTNKYNNEISINRISYLKSLGGVWSRHCLNKKFSRCRCINCRGHFGMDLVSHLFCSWASFAFAPSGNVIGRWSRKTNVNKFRHGAHRIS